LLIVMVTTASAAFGDDEGETAVDFLLDFFPELLLTRFHIDDFCLFGLGVTTTCCSDF
jgi:hypothetical protein